jgi:hypothetical protein
VFEWIVESRMMGLSMDDSRLKMCGRLEITPVMGAVGHFTVTARSLAVEDESGVTIGSHE